MMTTAPLRILILSDGLPGHVNQSRGLINWLSERSTIEYRELAVTLRCKGLARLLLPWILHHFRNVRLVTRFYGSPENMTQKPDLIISAGGNTAFLNVALARIWQVPNIFLGSRRRLHSDDFSAHLTLEPTGQPHNIVMDLAPTMIELTTLEQQGQALRQSLATGKQQKLYMLAFGGDGAGYRYDEKSCRQLAEFITTLSQRDDCRWLLTTSRRTDPALAQKLKQFISPEIIADAVWWHEVPRKVMSAYMGAADCIFVTIDSMSMISEAIASGKATVLLQPENPAPEKRYAQALYRFCKKGFCAIQPLDNPPAFFEASGNNIADARERLLDALDDILPAPLETDI